MKQMSNRQNSLLHVSATHSNFLKQSFSWYLTVLFPSLLLLLLAGCQKNALQDSSQKNDLTSSALRQEGKTRCVPFKASFVTMDEMTQAATDANPVQKDHLTGTGEGTGMGRASIDVLAEGDVTLPFPALVTSTVTFVAANGDKIFASNDGYLQEPSANGDLHLTGRGTIIGGTGRFEGATGSYALDVTGNIFKPEGTAAFTGTICYK
ncbi:hypothetical protein [Flavisolibacter ginsengisoli]|uniref:Uncharacterized protein n=1 Tax=Flavisolibacter ginsengisoli DSM 18119 TaxID=1121884 RepID=A0A1M4Z6W3_9BACT|nr:hypothetical protein [Flavisolibacter ginsengisoli]SHF13346.1 hypothetical protein SAMN02745131_01893 [Flavisolibacter ginsengisoli DSM 18119]